MSLLIHKFLSYISYQIIIIFLLFVPDIIYLLKI